MELFKNCKMTTFFYEGEADESECDVKIDGDFIYIEYEDDGDGIVIYEGRDIGKGHYELSSGEKNYATLHISPESKILEGSWVEDGYKGMWKIELD